ncbi:MAG: biotin carboxylase N-terminal domain-containing protein [Myxococcota bacterium]
MFRRILMANRGEVAARVLRTCRRLGIEMVAVASEADRDAQWLADADDVVVIGPASAQSSYLHAETLIEAARHHGCAAVHPGWGFLSENARFATQCEAAGLTFIGPSPRHLREMGDKALARATMKTLGLPLIPGSDGPLEDLDDARRVLDQVGTPALLKAVSGGGGRGMRRVDAPEDLPGAFAEAQAEATSAFGDPRLYLERRIVGGRHVEIQVLGDRFGRALALGERECSLQRRHQKVLEEAPSPGLLSEVRDRILPLVGDAMGEARYEGAGTIEMLLDEDGALHFMEMNTRLQVEHPVTEAITGLDLVEWQLRIAANEPLTLTSGDVSVQGHAIEARINAEDPDQGFRPSPGLVTALAFPEADHVRVDTHLRAGDRIPPNYDSLIAKLVVSGPDRATAIERLRAVLREVRIDGVTTNVSLHQRILDWEGFVSGRYDINSLETQVMGG